MSVLFIPKDPLFKVTKILACRGCLATDTELHDLNGNSFAQFFSDFIGFPVHQSDGYPQFVCSTCLFLLRKFVRFRRKCLTAMQALQQMKLSGDNITTDSIKSIDRTHIKHNYQKQYVIAIDITGRSKVENPFFEVHEKLDINIIDKGVPGDEIIKTEKFKHLRVETEIVFTDVKQERIDSEDSLRPNNVDIDDDLEEIKPTFAIKDEGVCKTLKRNSVKNTGFELHKVNIENDFDENVTQSIKAERTKRTNTPKSKDITKTVKDIKSKLVKPDKPRKAKRTRKAFEKISGEEEELNDDWRNIIKEIKEEIACNKLTQRRVPSKYYLQSILKTAKQFAITNNVEMKFLTKEEQKIEIEEKRNSEKFRTAPYKCEKCCKVFNSEETFGNHSLFHSRGDYVCEICLYSFRTRTKYLIHFDKMHFRKMTCKECGQINRSCPKAREHHLWHQGNNLDISCEQCDQRFARRKSYLSHVRNAHRGRADGAQCGHCRRVFYNENGLQVHVMRIHSDRPRCSSCSVMFASADALGAHVNAPQGCQPGRSSCTKCGKNFAKESEMRRHFKEEHRKLYTCEKCEKPFKDLAKFLTHRRNHVKYSKNKHKRETQVGIQGTSKGFVCEFCGMEKGSMALLKDHLRTHTRETFQCDYCQRIFTLKSTLRRHIATHTGEKRYKCQICEKAFRQQHHRSAHMVTHTKTRPYACPECPKTYTHDTSLREHVNTTHRGLPPRRRGRRDQDCGIGDYYV